MRPAARAASASSCVLQACTRVPPLTLPQTYGSQGEADAAIQAMNEQELDGRRVRVNMANSKPQGGGYGGGYGSGCEFTILSR